MTHIAWVRTVALIFMGIGLAATLRIKVTSDCVRPLFLLGLAAAIAAVAAAARGGWALLAVSTGALVVFAVVTASARDTRASEGEAALTGDRG